MTAEVLKTQDLRVHYNTPIGAIKAVEGVSFSLNRGEKVGLVGESGCGKSTMAFAMLRLIKPPGHIESGQVFLDGVDLLSLSDEEMRKARFAQISLIPQGAMNSLNPVMRIKEQIVDTIMAHDGQLPKRELADRVRELLELVELGGEVVEMFPHELSGGMKQRVCIAIAISLRGCLKTDLSCSWREDCRASKVAFHEQAELSKRPERPTMAATRTTAASSQTGRPTNQVPASGGEERYSLCVAYRVRVADASSRPASLAHHIPLLSHLAARWDLGEDS